MAHDQLRATALQMASADALTGGFADPQKRITAARLVDAIDAGDEALIKRLAEALNGFVLDG